jgi:tyrosinase
VTRLVPVPRLQRKKGKPVREWQLPPEELRKRVQEATRENERFGKTLKLRPLRIPKRELLLVPARLPPAYFLKPWPWFCKIVCPPRYRIRKNQKNLTATEWARFIHAIESLAAPSVPSPTWHDFVEIHRQAMDTPMGMMWGAHGNTNFLTWHREYVAKMEAALVAMNPLVTIPYWDWVNDRAIPPQLTNASDVAAWAITRGTFNAGGLPTAPVINAALASADYVTFRSAIEGPHGWVHNAVGGTMGTSTSPADPLFWLHHAFIDKLYADWEATHPSPGSDPPNTGDTLEPPPIMTRTVGQVLDTRTLGYVYA